MFKKFTVGKEVATALIPQLDSGIKIFEAIKDFVDDANFGATSTIENSNITYKTHYCQFID